MLFKNQAPFNKDVVTGKTLKNNKRTRRFIPDSRVIKFKQNNFLDK